MPQPPSPSAVRPSAETGPRQALRRAEAIRRMPPMLFSRRALAVLAGVLLSACATVPPSTIDPKTSLKLAPALASAPAENSVAAAVPAEPAAIVPAAPPPPATAAGTSPAPLVAETLRDDLPRLPTIDLTERTDDLWVRVRNGFGMPDLDGPLVADRQAWYLNRPEMLQRMFQRSRRYLYHIVSELEKRGMPTELALLPMVESAYNPMAYSRSRALGIWQFIPSTGKNYKLDQDWWRDDRRDVVASTAAALDYLKNIYEMHGDWHLALASYNWGEHAVARAIAKNQAKGLPTDYQSLTMPGETRYYVPKLQALKNILAQPEVFGIRIDPIPNSPYFATVDIPGDIDIALAAKLADVPLDEFIALNPAHHRPLIRSGEDSQLLLPADKIKTFLRNLERHEAQDKPLATWRTYQLKKGDRLDRVAARFGLTVARLKQLNGLGTRTKARVGLNLLVPGTGAQIPDQLAEHLPSQPPEPVKIAGNGKNSGSGKSSSGSGKNARKSSAEHSRNKSGGSGRNKTKSAGKPAKGKRR